MSEFFDSDLVKEGLEDIHGLQTEIYQNAFKFGTMSRQDKIDHIDKLTNLLEKQKLMYTIISEEEEGPMDQSFFSVALSVLQMFSNS